MGVDMIALFDSIPNISTKHRKTLRAVFAKPTLASMVLQTLNCCWWPWAVWCMSVKVLASRSPSKMSNGVAIARIQAKRPSGIKWKKCESC
jgi:hypothetical protein